MQGRQVRSRCLWQNSVSAVVEIFTGCREPKVQVWTVRWEVGRGRWLATEGVCSVSWEQWRAAGERQGRGPGRGHTM